ncbi:head GIN domain-containing protein [Sphingomonas arantia]|uniref:Head GIN domain-containing protein n=1 Tax=Sphingomonas arantia TaxID=1460676 RepID=A0ABW4U0F7_9SPHN
MRRLAALLLVPVLLAASPSSAADALVTRRFPASGFAQIDLRGSDNVIVRVGPAFSVVATGPAVTLKTLTAEVRGGTLVLDHHGNSWSWRKTPPTTITVTMPALAGVSLSGSGDMTVGPFRAPRFSGALAGSGNLRLARIEAGQVALSIAGSGDLVAAGQAGAAKLSIAGSGNLDAGALAVRTLATSTAGSGDMIARAAGTASVSMAGSGGVTVHGPARCTVSKAGSGDVRCNAA